MSKGVSITLRCWASKPDKSMEQVILNCPYKWYAAKKAYEYARTVLQGRWRAGEKIIVNYPYFAYLYSKFVIKGRWKEAEKTIVTESESSYLYARYILKGRFKQAEENNCWKKGNTKFIVLYAKYVMKNRWKKYENLIARNKHDSYCQFDYAKNLIKGRWKRIENNMADSRLIADYMKLLEENEKEEFYNRVLMEAMGEKPLYHYNHAKHYIENLKQKSSEKVATT